MRRLLILVLSVLTLFSCKKNEVNNSDGCNASGPITRTITDRPATVVFGATIHGAYLVEDGSIDSKLIPCNLEHEFMQEGLKVRISGDIKARPATLNEPCCSENIVLSKIVKQ